MVILRGTPQLLEDTDGPQRTSLEPFVQLAQHEYPTRSTPDAPVGTVQVAAKAPPEAMEVAVAFRKVDAVVTVLKASLPE